MSLLDQLPRLSAYDPGAVGEGGLDPLGLAAIADRIADILVPGLRARMSRPRFATISAVGAVACQAMHGTTTDDGKTTADIAFEWLVVEGIVRNPGDGRTRNLPGSQKAARAKAKGERLSRRTYLSAPRVFGFTGVYRPFARDSGIVTPDGLPDENSLPLLRAWERDFELSGYVDGVPRTPGGKLRTEIADACRKSLELAECAAPPTGQLLRDLAGYLAPTESRRREKQVLHRLIAHSQHEIRNELAANIMTEPGRGLTEPELARRLLQRAGIAARPALRAAINYEDAATALDHTFRRFLAHATQQHGAVISPQCALNTPGLSELAGQAQNLVKCAMDSVGELETEGLSIETADALLRFDRSFTPSQLLDALIERHQDVQDRKGKLPWLDRVGDDWTVRVPYRNQNIDVSDEIWANPIRLTTLATFLRTTS